MMLRPLSQAEYRERIGLSAGDVPSRGEVADLCRWALWRWGPRAQAAVTRFANSRLVAAGWAAELGRQATREAVEALLVLGDVAKARVAGHDVLVPTQVRLVRLSDETLGLVGGVPSRLVGLPTAGVARRFRSDEVEVRARLSQFTAVEAFLDDWLGDLGPARLRPSDAATPAVADAEEHLREAWAAMTAALEPSAAAVADQAKVATLTGAPGDWFGSPEHLDGRWGKPPAEEGVWLGATRGFQDSHQNYQLVCVRAGAVRVASLYDRDEACWAPLLRGAAHDQREQYILDKDDDALTLRLTFPPPRQLCRALHLMGDESSPWCWRLRPDVRPAAERTLWRCGAALAPLR